MWFFFIPLMIKGKHSGELCRLQARISIPCRCWGEMACFRRRTIQYMHRLSPAARRLRRYLTKSVSSHSHFHLTLGIWHCNIFQPSRNFNGSIIECFYWSISSGFINTWSVQLDWNKSDLLSVTLVIFDWLLWNRSSWCSFTQLNMFTPPGLLLCFHRRMTLRWLRIRPKTSPRRTQKGSDWWSSPRARTTPLQLLVGFSFLSTLAPFGHIYPSLKLYISKLQRAEL